MNSPWFLLLMVGAGFYVAKLWRDDCRAASTGVRRPGMLPGTAPASRRAIVIAVAGALLLLAVETIVESALGLAAQQTRMTWLFAFYSIAAAPVIEEVIFRGWLLIEKHGRAVEWCGAIAASIVFAVAHPFLWRWDEQGFAFTLGPKGWFSSAMLFTSSLWFYAARLGPWNPTRSLLPCFAAHAARNAGVIAVKAATGFVSGLW